MHRSFDSGSFGGFGHFDWGALFVKMFCGRSGFRGSGVACDRRMGFKDQGL